MPHAAPTAVNRTLPLRQPNAAYRQREYLTEAEVNRLIVAARKRGRNGPRDSAAILLAYRHGLRAAELCSLRWVATRSSARSVACQSSEGRRATSRGSARPAKSVLNRQRSATAPRFSADSAGDSESKS
jgi:integrase